MTKSAVSRQTLNNPTLAVITLNYCYFSAIQASKDPCIPADRILYFNFEDPLMLLEKGPAVFDEVISVHTEYAGISPELVLFDESLLFSNRPPNNTDEYLSEVKRYYHNLKVQIRDAKKI